MTCNFTSFSYEEDGLMIMKEWVGKPSEIDSIMLKISSKASRGKKDSTKGHHHRHHQQQPGEHQFPTQLVTG